MCGKFWNLFRGNKGLAYAYAEAAEFKAKIVWAYTSYSRQICDVCYLKCRGDTIYYNSIDSYCHQLIICRDWKIKDGKLKYSQGISYTSADSLYNFTHFAALLMHTCTDRNSLQHGTEPRKHNSCINIRRNENGRLEWNGSTRKFSVDFGYHNIRAHGYNSHIAFRIKYNMYDVHAVASALA